MSKYAVQVKDVRKQFSYSRHKNNSLKRAITQVFKKKDTGKDSFFALDGISFNVEKGDFFGIVGRNGSGKSTLLKIISEIYQPTEGSVTHEGKLVSFIELGVGFKPELTGRENIYLNAALLGFSRDEIDVMYDDIVEFAELENFMEQSLKNYSSGMKVRLAFSVAIRARADILILDEVLAVGDAAFQRKCNNYFKTLKNDKRTVILVTHNMSAVRQYCNKAILIEGGKIVDSGDTEDVADAYVELFNSKPKAPSKKIKAQTKGLSISGMRTSVKSAELTVELAMSNSTKSSLEVDVILDIFKISDGNRRIVAGTSSSFIQKSPIDIHSGSSTTVNFSIDTIMTGGDYEIGLLVKDYKARTLLYSSNSEATFSIGSKSSYMPVIVPAKLDIEN